MATCNTEWWGGSGAAKGTVWDIDAAVPRAPATYKVTFLAFVVIVAIVFRTITITHNLHHSIQAQGITKSPVSLAIISEVRTANAMQIHTCPLTVSNRVTLVLNARDVCMLHKDASFMGLGHCHQILSVVTFGNPLEF
jgi:hypothetical protein